MLSPAVAVVAVGPSVELPLLLLLFGFVGLTWAAIGVTATGQVTRLADRDRGTALGIYAAAACASGGLGSVLGGWLASVAGYLVTFGVAGTLVLASVGVVVAVGSADPRPNGEQPARQ